MAEEPQTGGGGAGGSITLPGVGPVKKKIVFVIGGATAAFLLWRYYQGQQAASAPVPGDSDGDGFADGGTLPSVSGAVSPDNSYGLPTDSGQPTGTDAFGFTGTTNSQWSQYAANQLSAASDKWSYGDVVDALGAFLANKALTSVQQQIVQAAIGLAGQPPEGTHPIIPGGDAKMLVAPTGVHVISTTPTTVVLGWNQVAGAQSYRAYRSGASTTVGVVDAPLSSLTVSGLTPNTSYSFQIAADTIGAVPGPKSSPVTGKTKAITLSKPGGVKVSSVSRTSAKVSWSGVSGADYYRIYINGVQHGSTDAVNHSYTVVGLSPNHSYKVKVAADTTHNVPGPASGEVSFRTKK